MAEGSVIVAPGAKGSFPSSTDDAMKPTSIIPLSNPHTRTTGFQGTRMYMAEPPGTKSGSRFTAIVLPKSSKLFRENQMFIVIVGGVPHEILSTMAEPVLI